MMRLGHLYLIFLVSFVSATPFGYVIQSGATAKASATSGAFGGRSDLPLNIPTDSGFSGSFSKSSSSSFSSASASSSSSSFSLSGDVSSDKGGLRSHVGTGCGTSRCQHNTPLYNTQSSEAKPSSDPVTNKQGCSFGHCQHSTDTTGTQVSSVTSQVSSGSNAVSAIGGSSGLDYSSKKLAPSWPFTCKDSRCSNYNITLPGLINSDETIQRKNLNTGFNEFPKACSSGLCEGTTDKDTEPLSDFSTYDIPAKIKGQKGSHRPAHNVQNIKGESELKPDCNFGDCTFSQYKPNNADSYAFDNKRLLTSFQTHKGTPCFSSNCQQSLPIVNIKPSSYDVPIATNVNTIPTNFPHSHSFINENYFTPDLSTIKSPIATTPSNTNDKLSVYTGSFGGPPGLLKPGEFVNPASTQTKYKPNVLAESSKEKLPNYVGGFGGPPGLLRPNEFDTTKHFVNVNSGAISEAGHFNIQKPEDFGKPAHSNLPTDSTDSFSQTGAAKPPTYTGGFGAPSGTDFSKPNELDSTKPSVNVNSEAVAQAGQPDISKPGAFSKPTNQQFPSYTPGSTGPTGEKPIEFSTGYSPISTHPSSFINTGLPTIFKPTPDVKPVDNKPPTYTGGFVAPSGTDFIKPNELDSTKPSVNVNSEAVAQASQPDISKPSVFSKPTNQEFPSYTPGSTSPTGVKPTGFNTGYSPISTHPSSFFNTGHPTISKPTSDVKPVDHKPPTYTGGFGAPSGTDFSKPNEFDSIKLAVNVNSEAVAQAGQPDISKPGAFSKPTNQQFPSYTPGSTGPTDVKPTGFNTGNSPISTHPSPFFNTGHPTISKPTSDVKPVDHKPPTYTGGFGAPSGTDFIKPNELDSTKPSVNVNSEAVAQASQPDISKPSVFSKPTNQQFPSYTPGSTSPTGVKPTGFNTDYSPISTHPSSFFNTGHPTISKPTSDVKPVDHKPPTYTGGFGAPSGTDFSKPNEFDSTKPSVNVNSEAVAQAGQPDISKPGAFSKPTNQQFPSYTPGSTGPTGVKPIESSTGYSPISTHPSSFFNTGHPTISKPTSAVKPVDHKPPTYTAGFGAPSGTDFSKPNEFDSTKPSVNVNSEAVAQASQPDISKPSAFSKPTNQQFPSYTPGSTGPTGVKPIGFNTGYSPISTHPSSFFNTGHPTISKPTSDVKPVDHKPPTYTGGFGAPSGTDFSKPNEFDSTKLSVNVNSEAVAQAGQPDISKPGAFSKPTNQQFPSYTPGSTGPTGVKPTGFNTGYSPVSTHPSPFFNTGPPTISKPTSDVKPVDHKPPTYTGGFGAPSGTDFSKPNEFDSTKPAVNVNSEAVAQASQPDISKPGAFSKPTTQQFPSYTPGSTGPTGVKPIGFNTGYSPISNHPSSFFNTGHPTISKPTSDVQPVDHKPPTYTGGFGAPSGTDFSKPNEFDSTKPSVNVNSEAVAQASQPDISKPGAFSKPTTQQFPSYTPGSTGPTGVKPTGFNTGYSPISTHPSPFFNTGHPTISKPTSDVKPVDHKPPTYTGGFGAPSGTDFIKPNELDSTKPSVNVNSEAVAQASQPDISKPSVFSKPTNQQFPSYTPGSTGPTGVKPIESSTGYSPIHPSTHPSSFFNTGHPTISKPTSDVKPVDNKPPTYTGGFGAPSGTDFSKPNEFDSTNPSVNVNSEAVAQAGHPDISKPGVFSKPTNEQFPSYTPGLTGATGVKPIEFNTGYSPISTGPGAFFNTGHPIISKPTSDIKPVDHKPPTYTGGFGAPSGTDFSKPDELGSTKPSVSVNSEAVAQTGQPDISKPGAFSKPSYQKFPSYTTGTTGPTSVKPIEFNTASSPINTGPSSFLNTGHPTISKPTSDIKPVNQKPPTYTGGFGAPLGTEFGKLNQFEVAKPFDHVNGKQEYGTPTAETMKPAVTTSVVTPSQLASSGLSSSNWLKPDDGLSAGTKAEIYSGGFGGPPGLLKPFDDSKLNGDNVHFGSKSGIKHGVGNSDYGTPAVGITGIGSFSNGQGTSRAGASITNYDSTATGLSTVSGGNTATNHGNNSPYRKKINENTSGSFATALASSGATASAAATAFGNDATSQEHNFPQVSNNKQVNAHSSGTNFGFSRNLPQNSYSNGWNSGLNTASASAKSGTEAVSGARAFNIGGSFASSSASAHASSGYFTKGDYRK